MTPDYDIEQFEDLILKVSENCPFYFVMILTSTSFPRGKLPVRIVA